MALIAAVCIPFFALLVLLYNKKIVEGQRNVMVSYAVVSLMILGIVWILNGQLKLGELMAIYSLPTWGNGFMN
jgi:MFS superfamily sulfate permease-like transporter